MIHWTAAVAIAIFSGSFGALMMAVIIGGSMADDIRRPGDDSKEDDNAENCDPR
jgi:hypothetical protein